MRSRPLAPWSPLLTGLLVGFVTIMLVCGAVLAATMIFTTVSVSIAGRTREVATLRASGVSTRRLARLLLVALAAQVPGLRGLGRLDLGRTIRERGA